MTATIHLSEDAEIRNAISDLHAKINLLVDPRMDVAVAELTAMISRRHPEATLNVWPIEDPVLGLLVTARGNSPDDVDMEELQRARLTDLRVDERLPISVTIVGNNGERYAPVDVGIITDG